MQRVNKWMRTPVADRRKRVAELKAKGLSNSVIAKRLSIADTTVSQDLRALAAEPLTAHGLSKLDLIGLQALFLNGMSRHERAQMTGKSIQFTLAELSRDQLIAAILRQHETPAQAYPRVPGAGGAPASTPQGGGAPAGAGSDDDTGAAARPAHATEHSEIGVCTLAPMRRNADVGLCRACVEQGLFDLIIQEVLHGSAAS